MLHGIETPSNMILFLFFDVDSFLYFNRNLYNESVLTFISVSFQGIEYHTIVFLIN